jgi:hypothetical protein
MRHIIRQGDIMLVPISETPHGAKLVEAESGRLILARGEATGHHHSVAMADRVALFREDGAGAGLFLFNGGPGAVMLEHQEHSALAIPTGAFEVRRQAEYTPAALRRVED